MKWIKTFGPGRRVAQLSIEPAPALDLVEVQTVGEGSQVTNLFHLDQDQAIAVYRQLGATLRHLWPERFEQLVEEHEETGPWVVAETSPSSTGSRLFVPLSGTTGRPLKDFKPSRDRGYVEAIVAKMNENPPLPAAGEKPPR